MTNTDLISIESIEKAIYLIRREKVMLDRDLAALYGVRTHVLKQAVRPTKIGSLRISCLYLIRQSSAIGDHNL